MNKSDIKKIMDRLAERGLVFTNEKDFQFAFAKELDKVLGVSDVQLEVLSFPYSWKHVNESTVKKDKEYTDIIFKYDDEWYAIELKYKTPDHICKYETNAGVSFTMKQGAYDHNSYHCIKDIYRLETINSRYFSNINKIKKSFFVLLTNDSNYRYNNFSNSKIWKNYSLCEERGELEKGILTFENDRSIYNEFISIELGNNYKLDWNNYQIKDINGNEYSNNKKEKNISPAFSYLLIEA